MSKKIWIVAAISLFVLACAKHDETHPPLSDSAAISATQVKQGKGVGVIKSLDTGMKTVTLNAGTIPGVMDAMTMEYKVSNAGLLTGLASGDSVSFTLEDRGAGNFVVTEIARIAK